MHTQIVNLSAWQDRAEKARAHLRSEALSGDEQNFLKGLEVLARVLSPGDLARLILDRTRRVGMETAKATRHDGSQAGLQYRDPPLCLWHFARLVSVAPAWVAGSLGGILIGTAGAAIAGIVSLLTLSIMQ